MLNYLFGNEAIVVLIKKDSESDKLYLLMNLAKVKEELDMIKSIKLMRFPHIEKLKRKGNYNESDI